MIVLTCKPFVFAAMATLALHSAAAMDDNGIAFDSKARKLYYCDHQPDDPWCNNNPDRKLYYCDDNPDDTWCKNHPGYRKLERYCDERPQACGNGYNRQLSESEYQAWMLEYYPDVSPTCLFSTDCSTQLDCCTTALGYDSCSVVNDCAATIHCCGGRRGLRGATSTNNKEHDEGVKN